MTEATFDFSAEATRVVAVTRQPGEGALRFLVAVVAVIGWVLLIASLFGIVWTISFGILVFLAHVCFIWNLRGNAVQLGTDQMPALYRRVEELSRRVGLAETPDAYVIQAGGVLNALATRFLSRHFIVLFSDLLDACGENEEARDFIIAHELGHIAAGHLSWRWFLLPGLVTPFLGTAYSRACEYTCDRYGFAACGESASALDGLSILAAGGKLGPGVNRRALARQREDLNTAWMTLGLWFSTHPPIAHRIAALDPSLVDSQLPRGKARFGALSALGLLGVGLPAALTAVSIVGGQKLLGMVLPHATSEAEPELAAPSTESVAERLAWEADAPAIAERVQPETVQRLRLQIHRDMAMLAGVADAYFGKRGEPPPDVVALYALWPLFHPELAPPLDPFSGRHYLYRVEGDKYGIASVGFLADNPSDDLIFVGAQEQAAEGQGSGAGERASAADSEGEAPPRAPEAAP